MIRTTTLALLLALAATAHAKDTIELDSGRVLEGQILREEKVWIGIDTGDGIVWVQRDEIKSIKKDGLERRRRPLPTEETPPQVDEPTPEEGVRKTPPDDAADAQEPVEQPKPVEVLRQPEPAPGTETPEAEAARRSAEAERLQRALRSDDPARRIAAADWIVATWPKWREAVVLALKEAEEAPRLAVVRLLDDDVVEDPFALLETALEDKSPKVRMAALRVARHRKINGVETQAVQIMRTDPTWSVRQEAIRTLEDVGGSVCLPHVMAAWSSETDKDRRRRYRRVMAALLGEDFGDDATAWYQAADEVFMGRREIRKGRVAEDDTGDGDAR